MLKTGKPTARRLTDFVQVEGLYRTRLAKDFSANELKPLESMLRSWMKNAYDCYGLFDGEEIQGYAFFMRRGRDYLLDYFAIAQERRGEGLGSLFLRQLAEGVQGANCVLCEVENPEEAADEAIRQQRERRLRFYLRNGCRKTDMTSVVFGVNYRILEIPSATKHTAEELRAAYTALYRSSLAEPFFETQFRIL